MTTGNVANLVAEHLGELGFALQQRQQAEVDVNVAVRKRERIRLRVHHHVETEVGGHVVTLGDEPFTELLDV